MSMSIAEISNKESFVYNVASKIRDVASKLDGSVKFLTYVRQYDHGKFANLTTNEDWLFHWLNDGYLLNPDNQCKRLKNGINYWRRNSSENISNIAEDARENFNIDARIEFVYRDDFNACFHLYSFCSNKTNADKAYSFYDAHRAKLLKFISYFNQEINKQGLISEATQSNNLVAVPKYQSLSEAVSNAKRDYLAELKQEDASVDLEDREFEVMLLWSHGCTTKQIAEMLGRSQRTIESHIYHVKDKMNFTDRASMNAYFREKNWDSLVNFFLPYLPQAAA